jgi:hypothetical protein
MCQITNCRDMIESRERFDALKEKLAADNPKIFKALKPLFDEVAIFMESSRAHVDNLYIGVQGSQRKIDKLSKKKVKLVLTD